jgi:hypothetical protein
MLARRTAEGSQKMETRSMQRATRMRRLYRSALNIWKECAAGMQTSMLQRILPRLKKSCGRC